MKIGVLSDTHGFLDPAVLDYFSDCDEIWHAGDFGSIHIANQLRQCAPLRGVYGNIDDSIVRAEFPERVEFRCEAMDVWMTHIGGSARRLNRHILPALKTSPPNIFVCGHSHVLEVRRLQSPSGMILVNPGAAGHQGFHFMRTALLLEISGPTITRVQAIELGRRGRSAKEATPHG